MDAVTERTLRAAMAGDHRSDAHTARDRWRHPVETLNFFGFDRRMTVADIWPGSAGWTTELLAPVLRDEGRYIAVGYDAVTETSFDPRNSQAKFEAKLAARPDLYGRTVLGKASQVAFDIAPDGTVDLALFMRLAHVFARNDALPAVLAAIRRALKPGGVLGVKEHRARAQAPRDPRGLSGYMHQDQVIEIVTAAGFTFEAASEINANPADTADHPKGVWNLPPWLWGGEADRARYLAIGESDRMTLRFRRP
ncbi:MAG: methyltransferase [Rhodospirillaceae bacterium]|nr:methyltransferase [Rhodospirillaceae bacterium]